MGPTITPSAVLSAGRVRLTRVMDPANSHVAWPSTERRSLQVIGRQQAPRAAHSGPDRLSFRPRLMPLVGARGGSSGVLPDGVGVGGRGAVEGRVSQGG